MRPNLERTLLAGLLMLGLSELGSAAQIGRPAPPLPGPGLELLGGPPLSTAPTPWPQVDHSLRPTALWGNTAAPLPTNAWWQNLTLGAGESVVNALPYTLRIRPDGVHMCRPQEVVTATFIITAFLDNMTLGAVEPLGQRTVVDHDELSVTVEWGGGVGRLRAPIVRGMPYVTGLFEGLTPELGTQHAILKVNGAPATTGTSFTGTRFTVELNNGQTWAVYASSALTLTVSGGSVLRAGAPFDGSLRLALLPPGLEAILDAYAGRIPLGGEVRAQSLGDQATLVFDWEATGAGDLLLMTLPHHRDILWGTQATPLVQDTIKGLMRGVVGERWVLREELTTLTWGAPSGIDPTRLQALRDALQADIGQDVVATDTYFGGKQLASIARLALIADEVDDPALADTYRSKLEAALQPWLDGTNAIPLVYDRTWGGVVASNAIVDPGAGFGQGFYNDHHFHYGYFVYAAAALARGDPAWAATHAGPVLHLVRDIANPSPADPDYPVLRHMDWFVGHSWAAGLFEFGDSRNQESTSEAVNAWYGTYLWGLVTGDERLRDLARLLLATEIRSAQRYWQITSASDIYPSPFADTKVVGVLWSTKVDYATFFGNAPEFIHGIQMLPFTPISEELLRKDWVLEDYPVFSSNLAGAGEGWKGFIYMAHAVFDPAAAWGEAQTLNGYDDGNSRTNTLYWIATRP